MKLGKFVEVSVGVPDLAKSLPFYERLGFEKLDQNWEPWPWSVLTDGVITLNLSQTTPGAPVLNYFSGDMRERISRLERLGIPVVHVNELALPEMVGGLETRDGIGVSLLEHSARLMPRPEGASFCKCGAFGELAYPVQDVRASLEFWEKVGFRKQRGSNLPYPWAVLSDDLIALGLYQTLDLRKPGMVYYSDNTPERVEQLIQEGFEVAGEIPSPDNARGRVILEPPDRQLLFLLEHRIRI